MTATLQGPTGQIPLETPAFTLGRAPDNQLVLADVKASSHHAVLQLQGQSYTITDTGSSNGTYVNELPLSRDTPTPLKNGDRIRIGDTTYTYQESQPAASAYTPTVLANSNSSSYEPTVMSQQRSATPSAPASTPAPAYQAYNPPVTPAYPAAPVISLYDPSPEAPPQTWGATMSPAYTPAPPQKKGGGLKLLLIVLAVVLVLGGAGGGVAAYFLSRPQPTISLTSAYIASSTPAGAPGTTFKVAGHKFSSSSAITFLLDNSSVPGGQAVTSTSNGDVSATLTVTAAWSVGNHTLTAKDASGYLTQKGVVLTIVTPGQAKTPGPNGAPSDDASGTILASIQSSDGNDAVKLTVTGKPDGGSVCRDVDDDQPHQATGTSSGIAYTETTSATCSGSYKGGKLTYTETVTSDKIAFANGVTCVAHVPYVARHLEGTFTDHTSINGSYSSDAVTVDCNQGLGSSTTNAGSGTWTGAASLQ